MAKRDLTTDPLENPRYKKFAYLIATGDTLTSARRESRVGGDTSGKLLRDPKVLGYIQQVRQEMEAELKITRQDVIKGQLHAIRQADMLGDPMPQITGWKEIARMEGMYAPEQHEHHHSGHIKHMKQEMTAMTDAELEKVAEGEIYEGEYTECPSEESDSGG